MMDDFPRTSTSETVRGLTGKAAPKNVPDPERLINELKYIKDSLSKLTGLERRADGLLKALTLLKQTVNQDLPLRLRSAKLETINDIVVDLQLRVPLPDKFSSTDSHAHQDIRGGDGCDDLEVPDQFTDLHLHVGFQMSSAFRDFRVVYESLDFTTKQCLLCFAAIPKNEIVKKRLMIYWWIGEDFLRPKESDDEVESYTRAADRIIEELVKKDCIEPVNGKGRLVSNSYRMSPFIRSAVIVLAKEDRFFDFDKDTWDPVGIKASSGRPCLINGFSHKLVDIVYNWVYGSSRDRKQIEPEIDLEKVKAIFNVNEPYLDFYSAEWFSKMKKVEVLCLGKWQTSAENHIIVKDTDFLKGLQTMKHLRFLSLQGISRITELPDSICNLLNLRILDLRACHNLEVLPEKIDSLKTLTHLDITECYLLDHMPEKIASLLELQVFKGFVIISDSSAKCCTLENLSKLKKLRKLSIYTNWGDFPTSKDVAHFCQFEKLQKLTITWEARETQRDDKSKTQEAQESFQKLAILEKLDLKCYPKKKADGWLHPRMLPNLKKLYVIGGELQSLIPSQKNDKWKVEILRMKYLADLKMDWMKLRSSFPHLTFLEKFDCPKLTFFPSTQVWSLAEA